MNYGPFNNPLKQVHVLQRLQNTIKVLEREKITDINGIYDYEHGTLLDSWQATDLDMTLLTYLKRLFMLKI